MRLALIISVLISATASAAPRRLTLQDAVRMALQVEPLVSEAHLQQDRARLGVLRAQLDRFSLRVDGSVQELWNKANIGGGPLTACSDPAGGPFCGAMFPAMIDGASHLISFSGTETTTGVDQSPSQWTGLSNFQANLNYFLFSGFRVEATVARAKLTKTSALEQTRQQRKDTALAVARAYWNVRRLGILRDVQKAALQRMVDAEAVAAGRVKAGLAPPIDQNRATQRKLTQMAALEDLEGQERVAVAQLGVALGSDEPLELVDNPEIPATLPATPAELVRDALGRRPEVRNAKLQAAIQHQNVVIARSNFYPQLTLFGLFQYGNNQFNIGSGVKNVSQAANPFSGLSGSFTGGAQLSMNFFDTLNTYTATGDAHYLEEIDRQEVRRFERLVDSDVRTSYANLTRLYRRRVPLLAARDVAADNLKIVEARYKNGNALIIEYLDAQIDLANAELALADITSQLQLQLYELQASLGFVVGVDHG
jgi:outer membrane protein TolC